MTRRAQSVNMPSKTVDTENTIQAKLEGTSSQFPVPDKDESRSVDITPESVNTEYNQTFVETENGRSASREVIS